MAERVTPFRIETAETDLEDLRTRLRRTRWAEKETVGDWSQGVPLGYLRELCRYWAEDYDWPARQQVIGPLADPVARGGDPGDATSVSTSIGQQAPGKAVGLHRTPPLAPPDPETFGDLTGRERSALESLRRGAEADSGYSAEHATRPQTIGYALTDSPAALAAWITEKFWAWTDHDGDLHSVLSRDELLDNLMLYWLPRTGASSARLYWESIRQVNEWVSGTVSDTVSVPVGCSVFPRELQRPSRRWARRRFGQLVARA